MLGLSSRIAIALFAIVFTLNANAQTQQLPLIREYYKNHLTEFGLVAADISELEIVSDASSLRSNASHVYIRQLYHGIPITNSSASIAIANGTVVHVANRLISIQSADAAAPVLTASEALKKTVSALHISAPETLTYTSSAEGEILFAKADFAERDIPAKLVYFAGSNGQLSLCWDFAIYPKGQEHWWSLRVSAIDGTILEQNDRISHCSFDHPHTENCSPEPQKSLMAPPPPGTDQYFVYALPVESPNHGDRSLVINPSDQAASPFGWHDDNGIAGDEYTITRGNNVFASDDIDDDDIPGYSPDGTSALNFNFPYDSLVGVQGNLDAVITNLFYMNNMMHDIWHFYGFDEASGNFQQTNYSGNGLGDDFVFADAQDGSGSNNANFGTPPEGESPRMQMFLWTESNVPDLLTVNSPSALSGSYTASTAGFGPPVTNVPITADFVLVQDDAGSVTDGCDNITNGSDLNGKIALVRRGNCTFAAKVENCQQYGALAVIVMNNVGGAPTAMGGSSATAAIPAIMISQTNGNTFETALGNGDTINGTIVAANDLTATDSDFDNMIIAHEYGHGISTRLTGGAENVECLFNAEQMGEGWSDWFGLMITMEPGDQAGDNRGVGTYVTNEPTNGTGIRPAPYSTDFAINDFTYSATNNTSQISEPHGIGFVWATMLWDLNWALIDEYGFDPNVKTGTGGNNRAMALVIEGLKLQPCGPGFIDGRDAILAADELLYAGENKCLIWEVFARRGLGFSASQGDADSRVDQVQAFDVHPDCLATNSLNDLNDLSGVTLYPNPATEIFTVYTSGSTLQQIVVTNVQGQVVRTLQPEGNATSVNMTLSGLAVGTYHVVCKTDVGTVVKKLVKH